jgi:hypothetical protein
MEKKDPERRWSDDQAGGEDGKLRVEKARTRAMANQLELLHRLSTSSVRRGTVCLFGMATGWVGGGKRRY